MPKKKKEPRILCCTSRKPVMLGLKNSVMLHEATDDFVDSIFHVGNVTSLIDVDPKTSIAYTYSL